MSESDGLDYATASGYEASGDFHRAIGAYTELNMRTHEPRYLFSCGKANLATGAYATARDQFICYEGSHPAQHHHASQFIAKAAAYWWLLEPLNAVNILTQALQAP